MKCPKCSSTHVIIQLLTDTQISTKKKSFLYWTTIGWFIEPLLWIFLTIPKLLFELLSPRKLKVKSTQHKSAVCQNCGHSWKIR